MQYGGRGTIVDAFVTRRGRVGPPPTAYRHSRRVRMTHEAPPVPGARPDLVPEGHTAAELGLATSAGSPVRRSSVSSPQGRFADSASAPTVGCCGVDVPGATPVPSLRRRPRGARASRALCTFTEWARPTDGVATHLRGQVMRMVGAELTQARRCVSRSTDGVRLRTWLPGWDPTCVATPTRRRHGLGSPSLAGP